MKKAIKIFVPILLVAALLASIGWYLFVYDRDLTRDLLVSQARRLESNGYHDIATWLYNTAYTYSDQDQDVAIELAEQYKAIGNYTKAEYTLSGAIADGGNADLYIALCKTYVEQDKLLDAVTMLGNISDPAIKAELDARRPTAPTVSPEPGFYSQYISVAVESASGTLYVTTDGSYPSTAAGAYSGPITLPGGETTLYALSVSEEGLVSPLTVVGYTVGGVIEPVTFTDSAIEELVRTTLGIRGNKEVYTNDLWAITELSLPGNTASLDDLVHFPYLRSLTASNVQVESLKALSSLSNLETLSLTSSSFPADDLTAVASLPNLKKLTLADCGLSTIAGLANAKSLQYLDLSGNTLRNIEILANMPYLMELNLEHNAVTGLTALGSLKNLQILDLAYNSISDITPLAACTALRHLDISQNDLTSLEAAKYLTGLEYLNASHNTLNGVDALAGCTSLKELDISNNAIADIRALVTLTKLTTFSFSHNAVTAIPEWPADCALITLDGSYNQLENIDSLGVLENINHVMMDYNLLTNIDALADCHRLMSVNVYGNKIPSVALLTARSIVVNYDPTTATSSD